MKKRNKCFLALTVPAAVVLSAVLFAACGGKDEPGPIGGDDSVALTGVTASGTPTTKLVLTFSAAVDGLNAEDITLNAGSTGATKGALTSTGGGSVYELAITGVIASGEVTVTVSKSGYTFDPASKPVTVSYSSGSDPDTFTVWYNTGFAVPATIAATDVESGDKIQAPAALTKEGFTFKGWYTSYSVDSATGLWKYEDADEWNFDTDTVTGNMTLYAGWDGGVKIMPRSWIWANNQNQLQGRLIQLQAGKTYKMGVRYFIQPGHGPVYLQARYRPNQEPYTTDFNISLAVTASDNCFKIDEDEFTASYTGWYFIGLSNYTPGSDDTHGQIILHEIWLKEKGGGDINLLANGDFVWKDASSAQFHDTIYVLDPFHEGGEPRNEWDADAWNMNDMADSNGANGIHMIRDWNYVRTNGNFLYDLTGGKILTGEYQKLIFPKPAHP
ncbi:MAG: InlB B-repeat-containing protein [Treponema sp.]|jgi:hypothetical protein|nr:InlB B-repeat-containing protein [Treponema sp.]